MVKFRLATTLVLAVIAGPGVAQIPSGGAPGFQSPALPLPGPSIAASPGIATSRGSGLVSGGTGSPRSVMIPGSPVPGMLLNNGNGTSTIMIPGSPSEVVPTPR